MTVPDIPVLRAGGTDALADPIAAHAAGRFSEAGVLVLKNLLPPERVAAVHAAYTTLYGNMTHRDSGPHIKQVGDKRLMVSLPVTDEFASPDLFANPVALSIVDPLLGGEFILGSYVAVTSMPGAGAQRLHVDQEGLFGDAALDTGVPAYSVTLVIPLVGLNPTTGSTQFYPGSHRDHILARADQDDDGDHGGIAPDLEAGDAILFDSRITHGGMANLSDAPRPIVYCTYHRAWYRDVSNFRDMPPMLIDGDAIEAMGDDHRWLVAWALTEGG
jgi:ectoine hydroxylase-related dioxygenase (phytanoyl-CoA dioxygenase family)